MRVAIGMRVTGCGKRRVVVRRREILDGAIKDEGNEAGIKGSGSKEEGNETEIRVG